VELPLDELGIDPTEPFQAHELLTDRRALWKGRRQVVRLDPQVEPGAVFQLVRFSRKEYGTPCY
jgi:starch synthase (maltosyl-transferring)